MATVKTGGKECEEETLQTAFKKLRVDAESSATAVHVCEALASRAGARVSADGAKPKVTSPKENWLGCTRKSSRGLVRSQRRRRSKSPILHPPKFTYCSSKMPSPPCHLKHKSPPEPEDPSASLVIPAKKELLSSGPCSPVFGVAGYETHLPVALESPSSPLLRTGTPSDDESSSESGPCPGKESSHAPSEEPGAAAPATAPSDFKSLCKLQEGAQCSCGQRECQCSGWQGVEVYSFTGLREVISECERKLPSPPDAAQNSRTQSGTGSNGTSSSPRSCSEQARAYVDDITIEDLSGYMEYYLYIPKKMSHMAEMMYT
ncbi:oxidative stress-responsive serine-rich protein 1 [Colossoma macropomum]|uniref:oxidative stress-responsive serine-rich protein 1 n=1 Tax=Colossoma macropomum TaxID=42526 RepID=UPI001863D867|nr:oxidative stress-responsive serine-rich protein 1 [Colossoma macropomum]XP_036427458.1 oxidative stress-responsive serine-rich protein 1 [Colossoma macropomum]